jgi:DNA-binding GntR family transcriptional regulator
MQTLLSQKVYEQLYGALLDHRLKPGDRLNRRQVAEDLDVSVAPVLEAMTQLEWEGFLQTSPRIGTIVCSVTARQVLGKFRLRQAIEVEAARIAAGKPLAAVREKLERLAAKADAARSWSLTNFKTEVAFHEALVAAAGCHELVKAFSQVMRHSLFHSAHDLLPDLPERTASMHTRLVAALTRADADSAERLIRCHLEPSIATLERAVAHEPVAGPQPIVGRASAVSIRRRRARPAAR